MNFTYDQALLYIHGISWLGSRLGLERTEKLLGLMGNPEKKLKFIHVAGTNGKGSVCSMVSSVLVNSGYKTGLYTSPYILRFNERMQINNLPISDDELADITFYVKSFADTMEESPTEFELVTAIAFEYFYRNNCEIVVLEVGMGGRLDSTNVIPPAEVSVITKISLDHVKELGDTVAKIACEKAGIIKKGTSVVAADTDGDVKKVISDKCLALDVQCVFTDGKKLVLHSADIYGIKFDYGDLTDLEIKLTGQYQCVNVSLAIEVLNVLRKRGYNISDESIKKGLLAARWRARFEIIADSPLMIFDGGHNIDGVRSAVDTYKKYFPNKKATVVYGMMADKDVRAVAETLTEIADKVITVTPSNPRAMKSTELMKIVQSFNAKSVAADTVKDGIRLAVDTASDAPVLVIGSLYMYGDVVSALNEVL